MTARSPPGRPVRRIGAPSVPGRILATPGTRSHAMPYQYKRRRPSLLRNFWVYRRLIGMAHPF